ncbi:MAG TPA: hypothetical protein VHC43_04325 [Mycobacteriales bacterium]|nr:hypothetical protein [Mycobacteriales bacterium]
MTKRITVCCAISLMAVSCGQAAHRPAAAQQISVSATPRSLDAYAIRYTRIVAPLNSRIEEMTADIANPNPLKRFGARLASTVNATTAELSQVAWPTQRITSDVHSLVAALCALVATSKRVIVGNSAAAQTSVHRVGQAAAREFAAAIQVRIDLGLPR